jgi:peptidoglycan/LPS O-acetylase OafA/YrhL
MKRTPLVPLMGIRFLAIMHIFMYHLWANYASPKDPAYSELLSSFNGFSLRVNYFFANGWISTSLFFLLSGFILAYLYWGDDGALNISKKTFWFKRFSRLYPIHILVLILTIYLNYEWYATQNVSWPTLVGSAITTATLTQAWVPFWVSYWNWPTWALSVLVFLYICMPYLMVLLARLTRQSMICLLIFLPAISLFPFIIVFISDRIFGSSMMSYFGGLSAVPILWLPYFVAGMLLSRILFSGGLPNQNTSRSLPSWGDLAFLAVIGICAYGEFNETTKMLLRSGGTMPLFLIMTFDLANNRGWLAKLLGYNIFNVLGEISFSIYIWQGVVITLLWRWIVQFPNSGEPQLAAAIFGTIFLAAVSTYLIENPISRFLQSKHRNS